MSGVSGSGGFDYSVLSGYYSAQMATRLAQSQPQQPQQSTSSSTANAAANAVAPWNTAATSSSDDGSDTAQTAALVKAMQTTNFVNLQNSTFIQPGVTSDENKLFALYTGLSSLQALATKAAADGTLSGQLTGLDTRFQSGLSQIKSFVSGDGFDDLTMLYGARATSVSSDLAVPRTQTMYTGKAIVQGASSNAINGLTGNEKFTISVAKAGGTINVPIDLSQMGGTPSVDNIVAYMNQQMQADGLITRFSRIVYDGKTDTSPKSYGIQVQNVATEKVSFSAAASSPAIYVAGASGSGTTQTGQLVKFTDTGTSVATNFSAQVTPDTGIADARGTATDSQGNTYVVGSTTGDLGQGIVQGSQDVYLRKYDSTGQLIWSQLLGSSTTADGFAVAVDGNGNVAIAGRVNNDRLSDTATGGGNDSFVSKYNANGDVLFTRQIDPVLDDQANALTFGADGSLYIAGQTKGQMGGQTSSGGSDSYVQKLSSNGTLVYTRQFGTSNDDRANAVSVDDDGNVVVASVENGQGVVRKFADDGASAAIWQKNLGDVGTGTIGGMTVEGDSVYISGTTTNADLTAGGEATVASAYGGGSDGFVMKLTDNGTDATANFVSYIGTSGSDSAGNVVVNNGEIYVAGATNGALEGGTAPKTTNAYVAKLDDTGHQVWVHQYAGSAGTGAARAISIDPNGGSILDTLGLPTSISQDQSRAITANSSVRPGDYFYVAVNGLSPHKITIQAGDTMRSVAARVTGYLGLNGTAKVTYGTSGDKLTVTANDGSIVQLSRGDGSFDALIGLGITPGTLYNTTTPPATASEKDTNVFAMGIMSTLSLSTQTNAQLALSNLNQALDAVRNAYQALTQPAATPSSGPATGIVNGPVSAEAQKQLANYQTALLAFGGGTSA